MVSRQHLAVLLWVAALVWALLLILQGTVVPSGFFKPASAVLVILLLLIGAFDKWMWRWSFLHPWFVSQPDLTGTWQGQLLSTWVDPATNAAPPPIEGYLVIRQSFSSIKINLITSESNSQLVSGKVFHDADGNDIVAGIYRNTPRLLMRANSAIHYGGILLHCRGNPIQLLEGEYWTDRDTKGELHFTGRSKRVFASFEDASTAQYMSAK